MAFRNVLLNNMMMFRDDEQKIAIFSREGKISYRQLNEKVLALSQIIIDEFGIDNNVISVRMKDTLNAFEMILALLFSNKTILPLPLEIPNDKALTIIDDIRPVAVITDVEDCHFMNSISFNELVEKKPKKEFESIHYSDESNYIIIMTSGTTGKPKGCCLSDKAFLGRVYELYKKFGFNEDDNFLFSSNYSFDVSYTQILTWLFGCGCITVQRKGDDFRSIPDYVNEFEITHLAISPAVLKYVYMPLAEKTNSIKDIFVAGEKFPISVAEKYIDDKPYFNLWNMYGPTEFSIYATFFDISEYKRTDAGVPIGYALKGVDIKILDQNDNVIENDKTEGQIVLGGEGCFSGYVNNHEKTLNALIEIDGTKYYKTGDMGWFVSKKIYFSGRKDHQLKINGIRVEAEEIEKLILDKCPSIENVIIKLLNYQSKGQLVAFVVMKNRNESIDISMLKLFLQKHIESYFIPKVLFVLDEIPLNKNGKVDNDELQSIYLKSKYKNDDKEQELADLGIKQNLLNLCQKILNVRIDDIKTNIFDLGADSIDIVVLLGEIEDCFGADLKIEDVYGNPTVEELAVLVQERIDDHKIADINDQIIDKKYSGYLKKIDLDSKQQIALLSNDDSNSIIDFIDNSFGIEFLPNYIFSNEYDYNEKKENIAKGKLTDFERKSISELVRCQVEKNYTSIDCRLSKEDLHVYKCGPGQNKIFRKKYNDLVVNRTRIETMNVDHIKQSLNQVVRKHSLLRAKVIESDGKFTFEEAALTDDFDIEILDLKLFEYKKSGCSYILEELFDYVAQMNKTSNILYRWILVKVDEKTYELLTVFSHLISDAAASTVFSKEVITYHMITAGKQKNESIPACEYSEYLDELKRNYSEEKYYQFLDSKKYAILQKSLNERNKERNLQINIIKVPISDVKKTTNNFEQCSKEGILLWLSAHLASKTFGKKKISFRVTNNGRKVGGMSFDNLFGDCHVHYPLVIDVSKDSACDCSKKILEEFNYYYVEKKIYLEDLAYSQNSIEKNVIEQMFDCLDGVFNYIGEMDEKSSEEYCRNAIEDRCMYKTFYIYCYSTKDNYVLNCRLPINYSEDIIDDFLRMFKE